MGQQVMHQHRRDALQLLSSGSCTRKLLSTHRHTYSQQHTISFATPSGGLISRSSLAEGIILIYCTTVAGNHKASQTMSKFTPKFIAYLNEDARNQPSQADAAVLAKKDSQPQSSIRSFSSYGAQPKLGPRTITASAESRLPAFLMSAAWEFLSRWD